MRIKKHASFEHAVELYMSGMSVDEACRVSGYPSSRTNIVKAAERRGAAYREPPPRVSLRGRKRPMRRDHSEDNRDAFSRSKHYRVWTEKRNG